MLSSFGNLLILALLAIPLAWTDGLIASQTQTIEISTIREVFPISHLARSILDTQGQTLEDLIPVIDREGVAVSDFIRGGYHEGFYWVKIALSNSTNEPVSTNLLIKNRLTSYLEFFIPVPGENSAVSIRRLDTTLPTLRITLAPQKRADLYLKLQFGLQNYVQLLLAPEEKIDVLTAMTRVQEFFFGIIIGLLFFNLALYLITSEPSFALHALSALFAFMVVFMAGGQVYYYFSVDFPNRSLPIAGCFAVASMNAFGLAYLRHQKPKRYLTLLLTSGAITGAVGGLLLALGVDRRLIYFTDLNLLLLICVAVLIVFHYPPTRYRNMRFYVVGWLSLGVSGVAWLGSEYGILPKNVYTEGSFNFGMSLELIIVSLGLADRINDYKNVLQNYNKNLEILVDEKTRDIRSMMEHIPIGICMITADNRIHKDYSRRFREFFPQDDLDMRPANEVLFEKALASVDEKSQVASALVAALGEDVVTFDVNLQVLPVEMHWVDKDQTTHVMDLTWNAMQNSEGLVDRILVTMRDVTDLRKFQERSRIQQQELDIIKEILDVPFDKFQRFLRSAKEKISTPTAVANPDDLRQLFLNMHTIKGTARSLYFKEMTAVLHEVEQIFVEMLKLPPESWNQDVLQSALQKAEAILKRYEDIAKEKLNRPVDQKRFIQLPLESAQLLYQHTEAIQDLTAVRHELHGKVFRPLQEVLNEFCSSLPSLAKELEKLPPEMRLDVSGYFLTEPGEDLLRDIFVHILRNIMDHGLETPAERHAKGKNPVGRIHIQVLPHPTLIVLRVEDDGRGLNIEKIREQGQKLSLLTATDHGNMQKIAELIFHPSLSTAGRITAVSGRGVGMSAVREALQAAGGSIRLVLRPEQRDSNFQNFHFEITLPAHLFETAPLVKPVQDPYRPVA